MRPTVLVFAGLDPSGGAGIAADIGAIAAQGAHALPIVTALTVQDNERVFAVRAVDADFIAHQARVLVDAMDVAAVKIGIPGSRANAEAIAAIIVRLRARRPMLPVVLDPVLASGRGDALTGAADGSLGPLSRQSLAPSDASRATASLSSAPSDASRATASPSSALMDAPSSDAARHALAPLLALASLLTPNSPEALALGLLPRRAGSCDLLVTGGHDAGAEVVNAWHHDDGVRSWRWPRLAGEFHGSGCTLAAAIAARLALGEPVELALERAQAYCHAALARSFAIAPGQRIPERWAPTRADQVN